jgi:hypothetical protein
MGTRLNKPRVRDTRNQHIQNKLALYKQTLIAKGQQHHTPLSPATMTLTSKNMFISKQSMDGPRPKTLHHQL